MIQTEFWYSNSKTSHNYVNEQIVLYKLPFSCYMISPFSDYSVRPKNQNGITSNGEASNEKKPFTTIDDVLIGLVKWLCEQVCDTDTLPFYSPKYSSSAANLGVVNGNINLRYIMFFAR